MPPPPPRGGFFLQGFLVLLSNPKVLVFFGAFIPQFMDMEKDHLPQVALLGITFMVIAATTDAVYALLAGRARLFFSKQRTRLVSRISGGFMIGGGIWLALTRAKYAIGKHLEPRRGGVASNRKPSSGETPCCPICRGSSMRCCSPRSG